uniref:Uncharacterized protein n=1 Tax=Anguilla anguilla TaxID=7936 RepID=A0A0E9SV05_ANGAN
MTTLKKAIIIANIDL